MAKIGMRYPVAAKITGYGADGYPTYDQGIIIGRGVKASISYDTADAALYADDLLAESDASVVGYSGSLEVDGFGTHQSAKSEAVATIMQYLYNLDTSEDNSFEITCRQIWAWATSGKSSSATPRPIQLFGAMKCSSKILPMKTQRRKRV